MKRNIKSTNHIDQEQILSKLRSSLSKLIQPVINTMGPHGMLVAINKGGQTQFTKDGVTVMKAIAGSNKFEATIAQAIKDACEKTNYIVGDGTTTTVCLIGAIMDWAMKQLAAGIYPKQLIRGMDFANVLVNRELAKHLIKPEGNMLAQVATIAVDNDKVLGNIINEAISKVDPKYGLISVEEGKGMTTELHIAYGMRINSGYSSPYFATMKNSKNAVLEFENAVVLLINGELNNQELIGKFLGELNMTNKSGVIICDKLDNNILRIILLNLYQNIIPGVAVVYNPYQGEKKAELLKDLALVTQASIVNFDVNNDKSVDSYVLGECRKIKITSEETIFFHDIDGDVSLKHRIDEELEFITARMKDLSEEDAEHALLKDRYTRLTGRAAIIRVGAATGSEISEIKDRVYDAVSSVKSAAEGVCCGGGTTLYRIQKHIRADILSGTLSIDPKLMDGADIVFNALSAPIVQLIKNCGKNYFEILHAIDNSQLQNAGYDALNDKITDMLQEGIIDSYQVAYHSINNAISICKMLVITSDIILCNEAENPGMGMY